MSYNNTKIMDFERLTPIELILDNILNYLKLETIPTISTLNKSIEKNIRQSFKCQLYKSILKYNHMAIKYSNSLNLAFNNTMKKNLYNCTIKSRYLIANTCTNLFDVKKTIFVKYRLSDRSDFSIYNCNNVLSTKIISEHISPTKHMNYMEVEEAFINDNINMFVERSNILLNSLDDVIYDMIKILITHNIPTPNDNFVSDDNIDRNIDDHDKNLFKPIVNQLYMKNFILISYISLLV